MSQHQSLRSSDKDKQHRSVLKRHERIKILKDKEKWSDKDSVFGLQKVKIVKFKIKKEKAQAAVDETAEGAATSPGAAAQTAPASSAAGAKQAAPAKSAAQVSAKPSGKDASKPSDAKK